MTNELARSANQPPDPRAVIAAYFTHINADELDRLVDLFAEDAEVVAPLARPVKGRPAIREYYRRTLQSFSKHVDTPTHVLVDGDRAAVEIDFDGTTTEGRALQFAAVDIFVLRAGRIQRLQTFYDSARVLRDLGKA